MESDIKNEIATINRIVSDIENLNAVLNDELIRLRALHPPLMALASAVRRAYREHEIYLPEYVLSTLRRLPDSVLEALPVPAGKSGDGEESHG